MMKRHEIYLTRAVSNRLHANSGGCITTRMRFLSVFSRGEGARMEKKPLSAMCEEIKIENVENSKNTQIVCSKLR